MDEYTDVDSIRFEVADPRHITAGEDFRDYMLPYAGTVDGSIAVYGDDRAFDHLDRFPTTVDLLDTVRAQYEMVRTLEDDGTYSDTPFCCTCSNRGCVGVVWEVSAVEDVSRADDDTLQIVVEDLLDRRGTDSPYRIPRRGLYAGIHDLCRTVVEFCESAGVETFGWADRMDPPIAGRDHYATLTELTEYESDLEALAGE